MVDVLITAPQQVGGVMARKTRGRDFLEQAKGCLSKARTVEGLRQVHKRKDIRGDSYGRV